MKKSRALAEIQETARGLEPGDLIVCPEVTVDISEAKAHWYRLIGQAERGGRVVITRAGKPVAVLQATRKNRRAAP